MVFGQSGDEVNIVINAVDNFSRIFDKASLSLKNFQKAGLIAGAAGAAIAAGLGLAVSKAISFESAFTGVRKTVDLSEAEFADLEQRFKDLSSTIPITFEELSSIGEIAGQLGVEGVDNLAKFTRTIADISVTTNLTAEAAATDLARIANVMGEPISNIDRMGSAIVGLGNNFATSEQEILQMSTRIVGAGKTIGLTTPEIFGMAAAMSALGIRSEMGGSAMSRAMITIAKSVAEGGDELSNFAAVSGMSIEEFSEMWKDKPVEAISKVVIGLKRITDEGGNTFGVLEDLDLKSIRITDTMLRLAGSQDGISNAVKEADKFWEENIALTEESEKRYSTLESQIDIVKNRFAILGAEIGDKLVPIIKNVVIPILDKMINLWDRLGPTLQTAIIAGTAAAAMVLLLAGAVAVLTLVSSPWLLIIFAVAAAIGLLVAATVFLFKKWDKMAGWMKVLTALFFPMIVAGILLIKNWDKIKDNAKKTWEFIKDVWSAGVEAARIVTRAIGNLFIGMANTVRGAWNAVVEGVAWAINLMIKQVNDVIRLINKIPGVNIPRLDRVTLDFAKLDMIPMLAEGGIVRKPTLAMIGERGPEAVVPLSGSRGTGMITINIENINGLTGRDIAESLQEELNNKVMLN